MHECEYCANTCLGEEHVAMMIECIRTCRDCADICALSVALMARNSDLAMELCRTCAIACELCAEECSQHAHAHCQQCAAACRRCADICRQMATAEM